MDWTAPIDDYCERTDASLWSEPLNFASNAAFLVAAAVVFARYRAAGRRDRAVELLIALLVAVGIGSALFHSVATRWAMVADVAPIGVLVLTYLAVYLRRILAWSPRRIAVAVAAFLAVSGALALIPRAWLNNSQSYLGTLATMFAIARISPPAIGRRVAIAGALFAGALALRSVDLAACRAIPIGTHFLWHTANALTIYLLLMVLVRDRS